MKTFYTFIILVVLSSLNGYSQNPPNSGFFGLTPGPCPFDSSITIDQTEFWLVYQTLDGKWDGEIDSTRCINLEEVDSNLEIALDQIDPTQPLFVKSLMDDENKVFLNQNTLHNCSFVVRKSTGAELNTNEDCENGLCTGLTVGIEIPDSTGTQKAIRLYNTTANESSTKVVAEMCIATEKFDENYLKEFVLKFTFLNSNLEDEWLQLRYVYNEEMDNGWGHLKVYDMPVNEGAYDGSSYNVDLEYFALDYTVNGLIMYTDTTYPGPSNISFVDAHLLSNKPTQETINFYIYSHQTLIYQPFAEIRGGLIEGDDSIRHIVNIINNGGSICNYGIIDFAFDGTTNYVHKGGNVEFHGATSCWVFKNGGNLNVGENATFYYGNGGEGMLAICDGSTINIEKGGALEIDNHMVLKGNGDKENQQVFMELNPGSTLRFGENAKLSHMGNHPEMRLNVYMNGGILDDHLLSEEEQLLINKIYPEADAENSFKIFPNPAASFCNVSLITENETELTIKIMDLNGRLVESFNRDAQKGFNQFELDVKLLPKGMYFLTIESNEINASQKLIKL